MEENLDSVAVENIELKNRNEDHGWKTVTYHKKSKKQPQQRPAAAAGNGVSDRKSDVFRSIEQHSEERHRKWLEDRIASAAATEDNSVVIKDGDDGSDTDEGPVENGVAEEKKSKPKKPKKPKVTVSEAASKIDASDLAAFLADISVSYETQQDIQLMRFADYFGRAFSKVSGSQFPWMKILKESPVAKIVDIPISNVSEGVYKTSTDWLNQRSLEALGSFVLWLLDSIIADLSLHQGTATKGSKRVVQQAPSKSQVAIFVALAMLLRRKPDVLISLLPILKENARYHGQDKLPVLVWVITQACQGDLVVGLFMWVHFLFPMLSSKTNSNPQSRDLILQVVERITSLPKARTILVNGAVRKGERLVPPSSLELLMRATFPANSTRVKATERFEAVYPTLKEVALAVSPGSKAMKQITQQMVLFTIKAAGEGIPDLAREASDLFIWCLTMNPDSYKQWDNIYLENLDASVVILKKLSDEWKVHSAKHSTVDPLRTTLRSLIAKSDNALASEENANSRATLKEAQKHCKLLLGRVSRGNGCLKTFLLLSVVLAAGGAAFMSSNDLSVADMMKMFVEFVDTKLS